MYKVVLLKSYNYQFLVRFILMVCRVVCERGLLEVVESH